MKWLLISNNGNPGDIWVRLGIQQIIRRFDSSPKFIVRERDHRKGDVHCGLTEPDVPLEFDYSVLCGMPLLWSHTEPNGKISSTVQHESWKSINGWCSSQNRMIVAGFGVLLFCPSKQYEYNKPDSKVVEQIQKFFDKCQLVYSRSPLAKEFFPKVNYLHCPSVLAIPQDREKDLKLANFMPGGGHYPQMAPDAAKKMEELMPELAKRLIDAGFSFAAHREAERELAQQLGWADENIYCWRDFQNNKRPGNFMDIYSRCSKYFGNRVHGAIMSRAVGAECIVFGYDTRLATCNKMRMLTLTPFDYHTMLLDWIKKPAHNFPYDIDIQWKSHLSWWSAKLKLPIRDKQ